MFRFLLSARWIGLLLFAVVFAGLCVRLGFWQYHKLDDRQARNALVEKHFRADPVPLDDVLPRGSTVDDDVEWTRVSVVGTYDVDHQATVKFVTRDGAPGADVVTPLRLEGGDAVLVDRGWVATDNTVARPEVPAPPSGEVTVTGWVRTNSRAGDDAVRVTDGQVRAISSAGFAASVPYPLRDGYLNVRTEDPVAADAPALEPEPELGQGPHFWYAMQWWFFALLAPGGYVWFAVVEARSRREATVSAGA